MKVSELRQKLKAMKKDELQTLFVEMYKQIPQKVREAKEIDSLIDNPNYYKEKRKNSTVKNETVDFEDVKLEVERFIQDAYADHYIAPNRIISKKERSNWRFTAKRLVDNVTSLSNDPKHMKTCASLLEELYKLFCYASSHYVFASDTPFQTIKISQADFLKRVILLKKQTETPDEWIRDAVLLIIDNDVDYDTLYRSLMIVFIETLNNAPIKEKAVEICKQLVAEKKKELKQMKVSKHSSTTFSMERKINHLIEMVFMIQSLLGEYEAANTYFQKNYEEDIAEVKLYIFLKLIMGYQQPKNWLMEYERAVKKGIEPRNSLQDMYDEMKRTNEFPKYMLSY